ncbi:AfsR/SARP family transcriptional regulator [Actinomadura oligospora]|uniref:AfsR/SARP family transcriptional regulator n=1 Tax=Actinomadura oligospora TaxID=111804 RepID=UPI0004B79A66|nr:AfsR/SARP family transcriptional regulator [Actinomadura oligospora]
MNIRVLGPLSIDNISVDMTPTARKPRKVLALLLLNHSRVVPISALMQELWDDDPPKTAPATLQTYVFRLRKQLAEAMGLSAAEVANDILRTTQNGYLFVRESAVFDLSAYHRLSKAGSRAIDDADLRTAAESFGRALRLWRGPALTDVVPGPLIRAAVAGLEQSRLTMLDQRIELELRLGMHREMLGELATLVTHYPFREDLHAQFMIALYRSGYRGRALEAFQQLRQNMVNELGLEPSHRLQALQQSVLASDPGLDEVTVVSLPRSSGMPEVPAVASSF